MVGVGKLFVVDTVSVDEDNLEKEVECLLLSVHEKEDMARNYSEGMKVGFVG